MGATAADLCFDALMAHIRANSHVLLRTVHHVDEGLVIARVLKLCAIVEQLALRCVLVVHEVTALVLVFALVKAIGEEADFLIEGGLAAAGLLNTPLHSAVHCNYGRVGASMPLVCVGTVDFGRCREGLD